MSDIIEWLGHKQHFICAHDCQFNLATIVGSYVVSTIGEYHPNSKRRGDVLGDMQDIGWKRKYETMVFKITSERQGCGCPVVDGPMSELATNGYDEARDATLGHMAMIKQVSEW